MKRITVRHWLILGACNLLLVALLGLLMRINFLIPLPAIHQKHLLHAHSHFAFSGWISHALMVLIAAVICNTRTSEVLARKYQVLVAANLLTAYGMLVGFSLQGYGLYSIIAASLSVLFSYIFAVLCWRDLDRPTIGRHTHGWLRAALFFLVLSSIGTFFLAYLMASRNTDSRIQLAGIYFFLHFQYNGWFFFACMGLFQHWLRRQGTILRHERLVFFLFFLSCIPTYFLSILWWDMPRWLYHFVAAAAVLQSVSWILWLRSAWAKRALFRHRLQPVTKWLLAGVAAAVTIKVLLQSFSAIPSLGLMVYSFRPVIIGYLHLVLLVIITLFIIAYAYLNNGLSINRTSVWSTAIFATGVILNEVLLLLQSVSGFWGIFIASIPLGLATAAIVMVAGLVGLLWSQYISTSPISS